MIKFLFRLKDIFLKKKIYIFKSNDILKEFYKNLYLILQILREVKIKNLVLLIFITFIFPLIFLFYFNFYFVFTILYNMSNFFMYSFIFEELKNIFILLYYYNLNNSKFLIIFFHNYFSVLLPYISILLTLNLKGFFILFEIYKYFKKYIFDFISYIKNKYYKIKPLSFSFKYWRKRWRRRLENDTGLRLVPDGDVTLIIRFIPIHWLLKGKFVRNYHRFVYYYLRTKNFFVKFFNIKNKDFNLIFNYRHKWNDYKLWTWRRGKWRFRYGGIEKTVVILKQLSTRWNGYNIVLSKRKLLAWTPKFYPQWKRINSKAPGDFRAKAKRRFDNFVRTNRQLLGSSLLPTVVEIFLIPLFLFGIVYHAFFSFFVYEHPTDEFIEENDDTNEEELQYKDLYYDLPNDVDAFTNNDESFYPDFETDVQRVQRYLKLSDDDSIFASTAHENVETEKWVLDRSVDLFQFDNFRKYSILLPLFRILMNFLPKNLKLFFFFENSSEIYKNFFKTLLFIPVFFFVIILNLFKKLLVYIYFYKIYLFVIFLTLLLWFLFFILL